MIRCQYCERTVEHPVVINGTNFCSGTCFDKWNKSLQEINLPTKEVNKDYYIDILEGIEKEELDYNRKVIKLNTKQRFDHTKALSQKIYQTYKHFHYFITSQVSRKGKIVNKHYEFKRKIPLIRLFQCVKDDGSVYSKLCYINDAAPRGYKFVSEFYKDYYFYDFVCNEKQYIVLSETKLECEEYIIEGMVIHIDNHNQVTKDCKLNQKIPLLMINKIAPSKTIFNSVTECFNEVDSLKMDEESFFNYLFSNKGNSYRQPKWYEHLVAAMLFSGDYDGYKNHFIVIGQPETGKTQSMLAIYKKFEEPQAHTSGSNSTMKGLIPSFNCQPVKMGALINSVRFHAIDEFLRILNKDDESNRRIVLGQLNSLYDNITERFESGNGSAEGKMNCKVFAVSNPVYGTSDINKMCHWLDTAFLSRNIIYFQSVEHIEAIKSGKLLEEHYFDMPNDKFLAFFDYFNSFVSDIDETEVRLIYEKYAEQMLPNFDVSNDLTYQHYRSRQFHHMCCILDGIVKFRCLFEKDKSFKAKKSDYFQLSMIWHKILSSWDNERCITFLDTTTMKIAKTLNSNSTEAVIPV